MTATNRMKGTSKRQRIQDAKKASKKQRMENSGNKSKYAQKVARRRKATV